MEAVTDVLENEAVSDSRRPGWTKAKDRLRGKQPRLNPRHGAHLVALHRAGTFRKRNTSHLARRFT
jgi:hypothetical protein